MTSLETRNPASRLDNQTPDLFGQTPSQTVGPFFHFGLPWEGGSDLVLGRTSAGAAPLGEVVELGGRVIDGKGSPVPDALLEIWQANAAGRYASPADPREEILLDPQFTGFGRAATGAGGEWRFRTIRPGRVPGWDGALQAPHIALSVLGRGLLKRLATRIYFADCLENAADPVLARVPAERRSTLIAQPLNGGWRLDIVLQGPRETVFFAL